MLVIWAISRQTAMAITFEVSIRGGGVEDCNAGGGIVKNREGVDEHQAHVVDEQAQGRCLNRRPMRSRLGPMAGG